MAPNTPLVQMQRVISVLVNEILELGSEPCRLPESFVLVLDDLHLVTTPLIYRALDYLLACRPPSLHLAITTRVDPPMALARLRGRGQVTELRLDELRFTSNESATFLNERLGLSLSESELRMLQQRTEGWAVGLRLLAGSFAGQKQSTRRRCVINHLAQSKRVVFDFLAEEVLNQQTPERRAFLLQTSILSDLTPALCAAVTGRKDALFILEELERGNFFLVAASLPDLDAQGASSIEQPTYRYHALFAEFLRERLMREMAEQVRDLHRRAAEAQADKSLTIRHYLAAEMWDEACGVIIQIGKEYLDRGMADTLQGWIEAIPAASKEKEPWLTYFLGRCAMNKLDLSTAQVRLKEALEGFAASDQQANQGIVLAWLTTCALSEGQFAQATSLLERALAYPLPPARQIQLLMVRTLKGLVLGQPAMLQQAAKDFNLVQQVWKENVSPDTSHSIGIFLNHLFFVLLGAADFLEEFCRQAIKQPLLTPQEALIQRIYLLVHLWRGRLDEAVKAGERALALSEQLYDTLFVEKIIPLLLAAVHLVRGNLALAEQRLKQVSQLLTQLPFFFQLIFPGLLYQLGRAYCRQN